VALFRIVFSLLRDPFLRTLGCVPGPPRPARAGFY
jgi:hypothetical protein